MKRSKWIVVLCVLAICFLCAGCGGKENNGAAADAEKQDTISTSDDFFEWDGNYIIALTQDGKNQKEIVVPARCEGFTDAVFSDCSVETVRFEDNDDLEIGPAFMGSGIKELTLPSDLTVIPLMTFQMCEKLETIVLPEKLTEIGNYAFSGCEALKKVVFTGNQLKAIPDYCFENSKSLVSISIPNGVETIGKQAFFGCKQLAEVTMPDTLKYVGSNAFGNTALTEMSLPEQITDLSMDGIAFGENTYSMTVIITKDSWLDENRESWDIGFAKIIAE